MLRTCTESLCFVFPSSGYRDIKMDVILAVKLYINKMANESGPGMKIVLMDKDTVSVNLEPLIEGREMMRFLYCIQTSIISMAFSQSEMLQKEVYLFERLDNAHSSERMKHLKCIVFIRPTKSNIAHLCSELRNPRFGSYYICELRCPLYAGERLIETVSFRFQ